jgi:hypothetical protein
LTVLILLLIAIIVSIVAGFFSVSLAKSPAFTKASAGFAGIAGCVVVAFAVLWLMNVDPPEPGTSIEVVFWQKVILTAFTSILWLPVFLITYGALLKREDV